MAIFFVTSIGLSAPIDAAVKEKIPTESAYQIEPGKWMVRSDVPTSKGLSEKLGLGETTHLILPVSGYHGRSAPALWEWLSAAKSTTV